MKTINIEYNGNDFQAGYTFEKGCMGDHFNAPEGHFTNIEWLVLLEDDFVTYTFEDVGDTIAFPPESFITDQILELETNL